jgi:two-component system sensor histidine kinase UhpB
MYKKLSLQARLSLFISMLLCAALIGSAIAVLMFSPEQLVEEHEASVRLAHQLAETLNKSLQAHPDANDIVASLLMELKSFEAGKLGFIPAGSADGATKLVPQTVAGVPDWFSHFLTDGFVVEKIPVLLGAQHVGDIVFSPDLSADIVEKWVTLLGIIASGIVLSMTISSVVFITVRRTLMPLALLEKSLTRLESGEYDVHVSHAAPPEIARSLDELNTLAGTLRKLSSENRSLLRRIVTLQDEERSDLSRELHDELGPQLFAIRANAAALDVGEAPSSDDGVLRLVRSVEALQETNRRILDRLRPMHIQELGLVRSLGGLVDNAHAQAARIDFHKDFDPVLDTLDALTAQTIYRVIQEALTNVMRHADAKKVIAVARVEGRAVHIDVSDDGRGFAAPAVFGRGLTGMRERVLALTGRFSFERQAGLTVIEIVIPIDPPAGLQT